MQLDWQARDWANGALAITTLDAHAAGEPLRIITGGLPELPGASILERRRYMREQLDHVRRALMWEPRGHYDMYGAVLTPPVTPEAQLGVLFLHNEGYSTMCGHGVIALVTALIESGAWPASGARTPINLDTPAGLVRAAAHLDERGHVEQVTFLNVPSFVYARDLALDVPGYGAVTADVVFGGAFYAVLPAERVGLRVAPEHTRALVAAGEAVKRAVNAALAIRHPHEPDLGFLYGTIFTDAPEDPAHHSRNICVFANAEVDRSPTGTGVSARLALHHARGEIETGQLIVVESILGRRSVFSGRVAGVARVGEYPAVVPEIGGRGAITGRHEFVISPSDPLGQGFLV
ncbi:MAG TPA: proline racemase family protein [Kouleothrix sp.]|uniref:proline racemase family protein n=1 Tax=Kouleothrix sp. TaxID=2779161 RepID=UPI002CCA98AD|nr:proline racemase family protein [Kouleothrix sp.]